MNALQRKTVQKFLYVAHFGCTLNQICDIRGRRRMSITLSVDATLDIY